VYDENRDSESFELQIVTRLSLRKRLNNTICDSPLLKVAFYLPALRVKEDKSSFPSALLFAKA